MGDKLIITAENIQTGRYPGILMERNYDRSFVEGSQIMLSDGSTKAVQDLIPATPGEPEKGDVLRAVDGTLTYVVGMMVGPERPPIVRFEAEVVGPFHAGEKFVTSVTQSHAVMTDQGRMVLASLLHKGDRVRTMFGEATIVSKEWRIYDGQVWNMFLASKDFVQRVLPVLNVNNLFLFQANSLLGLTPKQHIVVADGILSGDWYIQEQLDAQLRSGTSLTSFA